MVKNIPSVWNMNDLPIKMWGYDRMRGCRDDFHQPWYRVLAYKIFDLYDNMKFISRQDAIVVVDFFNRDLVRDYLGLKAFTVRSGPDFEHFPFRKHAAPDKSNVKILTSGILMPHRRYEDAIEGIKILRDKGYGVNLTIMGDYENDLKYYNNLRKLTEELDLTPYVNFTGRVSEDELIASYHNHHIYTFQHHLQSDGLSPCEAASCGMALVVSKTAGCHEYFTHGETAMIIEAKNPQDWSDKVRMLIDDKALYERIASEANKFVRANFSWQKYASGVLDVFSGVHIDVPD
jgi:glycosyltransferase involved in cell wall biosynthesis